MTHTKWYLFFEAWVSMIKRPKQPNKHQNSCKKTQYIYKINQWSYNQNWIGYQNILQSTRVCQLSFAAIFSLRIERSNFSCTSMHRLGTCTHQVDGRTIFLWGAAAQTAMSPACLSTADLMMASELVLHVHDSQLHAHLILQNPLLHLLRLHLLLLTRTRRIKNSAVNRKIKIQQIITKRHIICQIFLQLEKKNLKI